MPGFAAYGVTAESGIRLSMGARHDIVGGTLPQLHLIQDIRPGYDRLGAKRLQGERRPDFTGHDASDVALYIDCIDDAQSMARQ